MSDYKTDYTPYLLQTQTDARGQKIADFIVPLGSLRDQFAMAAMTGLCANNHVENNVKAYAKISYDLADAMMEERK
jgi:hypothetical protein